MRISYKQEYEAMEQIDSAHVQALQALVESGEKASKSLRMAKKWVEDSPLVWMGDEIPIVDAATVPGGLEKDARGGAVSIAFKVDEKAGTVVPIDINAKDTGDHTATGWKKWTIEEILAAILQKCNEAGVPLTEDMLPPVSYKIYLIVVNLLLKSYLKLRATTSISGSRKIGLRGKPSTVPFHGRC